MACANCVVVKPPRMASFVFGAALDGGFSLL